MGNSFGNRVICEIMAAGKAPPHCKGVVLCGYPLYNKKDDDKNNAARANSLKNLPADTNTLVIVGTRDEFLTRDYILPETSRGVGLMKNAVAHLTNLKGVMEIPFGEHTVPKVYTLLFIINSAKTEN